MSTDTSDQPELACQWCGGTIPMGGNACADCGSLRPREDLIVPGLTKPAEQARVTAEAPAERDEPDDAERARQILKDLDAYIPEREPTSRGTRGDPGDDMVVVVGVLLAGGIVGGLMGWLLLPPLLHQIFESGIGVESDGPEAFRRLGAFIGALLTMLFAALLATMLRR